MSTLQSSKAVTRILDSIDGKQRSPTVTNADLTPGRTAILNRL